MSDERQHAREAILAGMAEIEDEYQQMVAQEPRARDLASLRWSFIRAYEALTPEIRGEASRRREQVEAALAAYRKESAR